MVNAQSLRNASDVVEVADYLGSNGDLVVTETVLAQRRDIAIRRLTRSECEFHGIVAKGAVIRRQFRLTEVIGQLPCDLFVTGLPTEVPGMREGSVVTIVGVTDHGRQHFAPRRRKRVG